MTFDEVVLQTGGRPGFWYMASPYSKYVCGLDSAFRCAAKVGAKFVAAGVPIYSPITHSHPLAIYGGLDPHDHRIWLALDEHFMRDAAGLIVVQMDGWSESYGIGQEVAYFARAKMPILYCEVAGLL